MSWDAGDIAEQLADRLRDAISCAFPGHTAPAALRPSAKPEFGDFQASFAMALGKTLGRNPREVAAETLACAHLEDLVEKAEIAGPGFVNLTLTLSALTRALAEHDSPTLGVPSCSAQTHPVAIDLCGVNVAKQMHVGHLRATIIGDTLARVHERLGFKVFRQNHLGDWGLPIAMTLTALRRDATDLDTITLEDLNRAYRNAQAQGAADEAGLAAAVSMGCGPHRIAELTEQNEGAAQTIADAKRTLVALQSGDAAAVADWKRLIECTMREVYQVAHTLNVALSDDNNRGESFYRDELAGVVDEFQSKGVAREDAGAIVVPFPDRERPLLIRKGDGGFLYATTDLAAVRYRVQSLGSARVIYVVDARQRDHFRDVFEAVRLIGWDMLPDGTRAQLVHLPFGAVLGKDKRPLKTRSGENFTLKALLDEAIERGRREVHARAAAPDAPTHSLDPKALDAIGQAVGIAAVKYADMSSDVTRDYVFDLDRMVSFEGDTGPYIQYAHARIASMMTKYSQGAGATKEQSQSLIHPIEPSERLLALALLRYGAALETSARELQPARVCAYLFDLANLFNAFYQACPVLKCPDESVRESRLRLAALTRRTIADGLTVLGIEAPERM
ncbi:MAG: arginine--tRNA ligase [Phycisphaerales bacterium]|nr:arginine--tRNA ligase [Phycisphaerales bacterium]